MLLSTLVQSCLLLFVCLVQTSEPSLPQIAKQPEDTYPLDGIIEFTCKGSGNPEPKISWHEASTKRPISQIISERNASSTTAIHINQYLGRLTISDPLPRNIYGVYCNVSNSVGWTLSRIAYGGLAFLDSDFSIFPIDKTSHEHDIVLLECRVPLGQPVPSVNWQFNGRTLSLSSAEGRITKTAEGDLHINDLRLSDAGVYTCLAENIAGLQKSPAATLTVRRKVNFIIIPEAAHAKVGESAKFTCKVDEGQITWRRADGEPLIDTNRAQFTGEYLILENLQPSDSGTYICVASDILSAEATLTVQSTPTFSKTPADQTVTVGDIVIFECQTSGFPKPSIYWDLPNETPVFPEDRYENIFVHKNGTLEIQNVRLSDSGTYHCSAHSSFGAIQTSATLNVLPRQATQRINEETSEIYSIPPIISLPPANQTRFVGETVTLDCEVGITRDPHRMLPGMGVRTMLRGVATKWDVVWLRGSRSTGGLQERLDFSHSSRDERFILEPGGGLKIIDTVVEDTGNYTCMVQVRFTPGIELMQVNWTASLFVLPQDMYVEKSRALQPALSPPGNLRAENITAHSLILTWEAPDVQDTLFKPHISYWIEMYHVEDASRGWQLLQESWTHRVIRLEPLRPDGIYYFLIRPRWVDGRVGWASAPLGPIRMAPLQFNHGSGAFAPPVSQHLLNVVKNAAVEPLNVQVISPIQARLSWNLVNARQTIPLLAGFTVRYKEVALMRCVSELTTSEQSHTTWLPMNKFDVNYCSLSKANDDKLIRRVQTFQQQLQTVLQNTQGVSIVPQENPEIVKEISINSKHPVAPAWNALLTELKPFRCYTVDVEPFTTYPVFGKVNGRKSVSKLFLTYEQTPSLPPQIKGLQRKTNHSVEVSWLSPPADSWNGLLTEYIVYAFNAAENDKRELKFNYRDQTGIVGGLKAGEIYHLQMAAVNCRGSSIRSVPLNFSVSAAGVIQEASQFLNEQNMDLRNDRENSREPISQSWVIGLVVGALVVWISVIIIAVLFCLRRQTVTKSTYPSGRGGPAFSFDNERLRASGPMTSDFKLKSTKDSYHLEPLIKPQSNISGSSELEVATTTASNAANLPSGLSNMSSDANKTSSQATIEGQRAYPNTTLASSNSSSGGAHQPTYDETVMLPIHHPAEFSTSPFFNHVSLGHLMLCNPPEFSENINYRCPPENSGFSTSMMEPKDAYSNACTITGLPLVAPVAQLSSPSFAHASSEVNSSVTPYATASLINNTVCSPHPMSYADLQRSRSPSDVASGASSAGLATGQTARRYGTGYNQPPGKCHSPQHFARPTTQYQSNSSSGTTTGEEDYLAHQQRKPRGTLPQAPPMLPESHSVSEYELCHPIPLNPVAQHTQVF